jgi:hypothetical protein
VLSGPVNGAQTTAATSAATHGELAFCTSRPASAPRRDGAARRGYGPVVRLYPEEPAASSWTVKPVAEVAATLVSAGRSGRPALVAIDGRSSSGKTTLAARICEVVVGAVVVHTDDIAWRHSVFGWNELLASGVLLPALRGEAVAYRPPAWDIHGRPGAIELPAAARLLIVEGVGAGRRELAAYFDAIVWVQSDLDQTLARDGKRVAAGEINADSYADWMAQERPFQAEETTWARAQLIVCGSSSPEQPHDHVMVAAPLRSA